MYEKALEITKENKKEVYRYFVRKKPDSEFGCVMYNVGIEHDGHIEEIDDFSPSCSMAEALCNHLYEENVTCARLFEVAEEFICCLDI